MDENAMWQRFCEKGRVDDYLAYRNCVELHNKTEMEPCDKDNCTGTRHKGTECR